MSMRVQSSDTLERLEKNHDTIRKSKMARVKRRKVLWPAPPPATASARLWRSLMVERYDLTITFHALLSQSALHYMIKSWNKYHTPDVCCFGRGLENSGR